MASTTSLDEKEFQKFKEKYEILPKYTLRSSCEDPLSVMHYKNVDDGYVTHQNLLRGVYEMQRNFVAKSTDVYVGSFPKSGTTWMTEIVFAILTGLDFERAKQSPLVKRCYLLEQNPKTERLQETDQFRLIKTHLRYSNLPKSIVDNKCKLIFIARNPKDTLVSFYHFCRHHTAFAFGGDFKEFYQLFTQDRAYGTPYDKQVLGYWQHRTDEQIFFIKYEELKKDAVGTIERIAEFLEKPVSSDQAEQIAQHCSFDHMLNTPTMKFSQSTHTGKMVDGSEFLRKGIVGDWKNHFDEEMNRQMDQWIQERFGKTDLIFDYE